MTVEPEKAQPRADERRADDRQLTGVGIERDLQVFRDAEISGSVREQRVSERDGDRAANRETIEPVSQVHRVR